LSPRIRAKRHVPCAADVEAAYWSPDQKPV
jgi:hypothetical protein